MATKKPSSISKHKVATTRKPAPKSPQVFDIIPRSQVRPQANSRPIIRSNQPAVADNTLTAPPSAPTLQLKHKPVSVVPSSDSGLTRDDVGIKLPPQVAEVDADSQTTAPKEAGVSVTELIAKRSQKAEDTAPTDDGVSDSKAAEDETKQALEEPAPAPTDASASDAAPAAEPAAKSDTEPEQPPEAAAPPAANEAAPAAEKDSHDTIEDDASLQKALNGDDAKSQPQEHSPALKEAIKDMDENGERPHHELYGGKPVIVVHNDHGMSAVAWVLWFIVCLALALLIVNFLLDADIIQTTLSVPHTNIL
jgi:hypothetical protein